MSTHLTALYRSLATLAEMLHLNGIRNVVLSPGSRSAPLAITFMRHEGFKVYHVVDERSAGYFALGLAKAQGMPTVLVCTSGTAAYNYAPAVAEAYFQELPLLVLTSDRPPEWIGQNDNQAIYQQELYGKHVLQFTQMPVEYNDSTSRNQAFEWCKQALTCSMGSRKGPIHLNFPFREPFYPEAGLKYEPFDVPNAIAGNDQVGIDSEILNEVVN